MKKSIDFAFDDHPDDDEEKARVAWAVAAVDDCDGCADLRVEVTLEDEGANGTGVTAHLAPDTARRVRAALAAGPPRDRRGPGLLTFPASVGITAHTAKLHALQSCCQSGDDSPPGRLCARRGDLRSAPMPCPTARCSSSSPG